MWVTMMSYHRILMFSVFLIMILAPLHYAYNYLEKVIEYTGISHPGVILVTIDTCQYAALGSYGNPDVYTPFIDRFSRHGVIFPRGYSPIPTTGPSHTTMMTGRSPVTHGVFRNAMKYSGKYVTLAKLMKDSGYRTAAFVSGYSVTERSSGLGIGFDYYDDKWAGNKLERDADDAVKACAEWINQESDQPFFVWLHLFDPHTPYKEREPFVSGIRKEDTARDKVVQNYSDEQIEKYSKNVEKALDAGDFMVLVKHPMATKTDPQTKQNNWTAYLSEVSYIDSRLAWLKRRLMESGDWVRSLIILTADHGEGFDHDYYFTHGDRLWESAIRVPWLLKLPMEKIKNQICRSIARHEDIFPTVQSFCNIDLPVPGLEGHDLKDTITFNVPGMTSRWMAISPPLPRKNISRGLVVAAFDPYFKLLHYDSSGKESLYLLKDDPAEQIDVKEQFPKVYKSLSKKVRQYIKKGRIPLNSDITPEEREQSEQLKALGYMQ